MKAYLKEITFPSTMHTYFLDITSEINDAITKTQVKDGIMVVHSKHTTMGVVVNEIAEPNLLQDVLTHTLKTVPEDKKSSRVAGKEWPHPTTDYLHRCQDNPYCDEIDEDYNAASHIRSLTFSHSSVMVPIRDGKLSLGKYQQVALFEFDGRDGSGKNPVRQRTAQVWIYPLDLVEVIK